MRIMNIAMMRNNSMLELRPPIWILRMGWCGMSVMRMAASCVLNIRVHDSPLVGSLLVRFYGHRTTGNKAVTRFAGAESDGL